MSTTSALDDKNDGRCQAGCGVITDGEPRHKCCYCADGRWVYLAPGVLKPCPKCSGVRPLDGSDLPHELERMHIPERLRHATLTSWQPADGEPRQIADEYLAGWPPINPILFFFGGVGTGKTHLACAILREVFERFEKRGQFWTTVDLLDRYRATFDEDKATESVESVDAELRRCAVLVLDDYGAHKGTDWAEERLFRLIDERYRHELPLIVTSNVSIGAIPDRVRSRLGSGVVVSFTGPDHRRPQR